MTVRRNLKYSSAIVTLMSVKPQASPNKCTINAILPNSPSVQCTIPLDKITSTLILPIKLQADGGPKPTTRTVETLPDSVKKVYFFCIKLDKPLDSVYPPDMDTITWKFGSSKSQTSAAASISQSASKSQCKDEIKLDTDFIVIGSGLIDRIGYQNVLSFTNHLDQDIQLNIIVGYELPE